MTLLTDLGTRQSLNVEKRENIRLYVVIIYIKYFIKLIIVRIQTCAYAHVHHSTCEGRDSLRVFSSCHEGPRDQTELLALMASTSTH